MTVKLSSWNCLKMEVKPCSRGRPHNTRSRGASALALGAVLAQMGSTCGPCAEFCFWHQTPWMAVTEPANAQVHTHL